MPLIKSGPADLDFPYRYGCSCGAIWNSSEPMDPKRAYGLCGPYCQPTIFELDGETRDS